MNFVGSTRGLGDVQRDYIVPPGARTPSLSCSIFNAAGKVEWDDVSVKLLKFRPVIEDATLPEGVKADWSYGSA